MDCRVYAKKIYLADQVVENAFVSVSGSSIKGINSNRAAGTAINLEGLSLMPGFVDIHVHGGNSHDTMDGTYDALNNISVFKLKEGVTSFCPTTVTAGLDITKKAIATVARSKTKGVDGAKIAGVFIEGPYINPQYKGAHPAASIREYNYEEILALISAAGETDMDISFMAAPEMPGAPDIIKKLHQAGVTVRLGHTGAAYDEAVKGIDAGAAIGVHTFNAMTQLQSREPGMVGAIMADQRIYSELICDLVHVHPASMAVLAKAKGYDKVVLVTDCMRAGGFADGKYMLGEMQAEVVGGIARMADGALAGSTLALNRAVRNMHRFVGVPLRAAVNMASLNPARALGMDHRIGSIAPGKQADLIGVDDGMNVKFVMIDGEIKRHA